VDEDPAVPRPSEHHAGQGHSHTSGEPHTASTEVRHFKRLIRWIRRVGRREARDIRRHKVEIVWALLFAVPAAWLAARLIDPPEHPPYKIHVVEAADTSDETRLLFEALAQKWPHSVRSMGDVPVQLQTTILSDSNEESARAKAEELVRAPDTLMVIGHLPSRLTEASLPVYMKARPQIPYISTAASDDDLLAQCKPGEVAVNGFVPLIQPSPRNEDQGRSAVNYAVQKRKKRFLLVKDRDDDPYADSLFRAWRMAITNNRGNAAEVGKFSLSSPPTDQQLQVWEPDCVLYAGDAHGAHTLINILANSESITRQLAGQEEPLLAILADSVVESRRQDRVLNGLAEVWPAHPVNTGPPRPVAKLLFTYATDAHDNNHHDDEYAKDAVMIADQLIADLSERGGDLRYRLRSILHYENAEDGRRNLVRIMSENAHMRSWYPCTSGQCVFSKFEGTEGMFHATRRNGMFHVWEIRPGASVEQASMEDVDGWHPPRSIAEAR
jgi:ABC-type branched-subunit amino acid transport system substrate-binding protein